MHVMMDGRCMMMMRANRCLCCVLLLLHEAAEGGAAALSTCLKLKNSIVVTKWFYTKKLL